MLEVRSLTKSFPGVLALDDVSVAFEAGTIHAVVGENGAGKSTLIKLICGIYEPEAGSVLVEGKEVVFRTYGDAMAHAIELVSQELQVVPNSSIAENVLLHRLDDFKRRGSIDWGAVTREAETYTERIGLDLLISQTAGDLSAAQKQLLMIAKALSAQARYLILDEPTSSLTLHEAEHLFGVLRQLRADGVTIIFVSHKLEEVLEIADRVTVLRDGMAVGTRDLEGLDKDTLINMMIGRSAETEWLGSLEIDREHVALEARHIRQSGTFDGLDFKLHRGEILGFYGLIGSGRTELAQILIGEDRAFDGEVLVDGEVARIGGMYESLGKYHMGYVSENRKEKGLILDASIKTNTTITVWDRLVKGLRGIDLTEERKVSEDLMKAVDIRATGSDQVVNSLSGGNQQKVSIAKWLAAGCDTLIVDEPTLGVDIGAKEAIHRIIWDLAHDEGKSIVLISSDLPEMVYLARRILVFRDFQVVAEIDDLNEHARTYEDVSEQVGRYLV
jgi:ribose transport system ATP-binding protein